MKKAALEQLKRDYVTTLKIVSHEGLSDAFAHLSARVDVASLGAFLGKTQMVSPCRASFTTAQR